MQSILQLSRYGRLGASSRLRLLDYIPKLEREGFSVTTDCLFSDTSLQAFYDGRSRWSVSILAAYARRVALLLARNNYDLIWLEKEALPWLPEEIEYSLLNGIPYVFDIDDAWFYRYGEHKSAVVRCFLGRKLAMLVRNARLVTAGNTYLADWATRNGAKQVVILPTVVDIERYPPQFLRSEKRELVVGWIGSRSTAHYLKVAAEGLARCQGIRLVVVGASNVSLPGVSVECVPWSEDTEAGLLQHFDIGIMPLSDGPWEQGKCGYKLIQYMVSQCPVVASPVGVNTTLVEHGVNGFLARDAAGWAEALSQMIADPALRFRMGAAGRRLVEQKYTLQVTAPCLIQALHRLEVPHLSSQWQAE